MATDIERTMKDYLAAWNSHDVDKILSFFTDDCIYEDVAAGNVSRGKEELKAFISFTFAAFPDFKLDSKSVFGAGDWGASEWVMSGTQAGDLPGIPATGKSFSARGASIMELHKGKLSRNTDYWNFASFLQQVGLLPGPPSE
ncbi:MAG: ester cyclase [Dehalococcoidia bacterium]|nr:ester cyclase [Dehalococcoidia bacterium]